MKIEQPVVIPIKKIVDETGYMRSFYFERYFVASPGQFIMLWLPGIDMKPFSISYMDDTYFAITVCKVGRFTQELFTKQVDDCVGIQGPYGTAFALQGNDIALVGGGYGIALLSFLADALQQMGKRIFFIAGVAKGQMHLFQERQNITYCLGTHGRQGSASEEFRKIICTVDMVYTAGPEMMMKEITTTCHEYHIAYQIFLERYIKCGIGICGQCVVDPDAKRVCSEGPVFGDADVTSMSEFGNYKRNASGTQCY